MTNTLDTDTRRCGPIDSSTSGCIELACRCGTEAVRSATPGHLSGAVRCTRTGAVLHYIARTAVACAEPLAPYTPLRWTHAVDPADPSRYTGLLTVDAPAAGVRREALVGSIGTTRR